MKPWINLEYFYQKIIDLLIKLYEILEKFLEIFRLLEIKIISIIISAIFVAGIIYTIIKIIQLNREKIKDIMEFIPEEVSPEERQSRWNAIKKHLDSTNEVEWRMAIMEADNILDEIIKKIGIAGENLGERLKNIEPSDFENLQSAWEVHKIRNKIAHEGMKFKITKDEAKRVISLFEKIFKEFKFI